MPSALMAKLNKIEPLVMAKIGHFDECVYGVVGGLTDGEPDIIRKWKGSTGSMVETDEEPTVLIAEKFEPLLRPKKFKIIFGGRGSGKSMTVGDLLLMRIQSEGLKVSAMREMMNSIDDSVHALFEEEIERLELDGFNVLHNRITHNRQSCVTYKGLARNPESVKSMHGYDVFWVEEAATLSKRSLDLLVPTLRAEGSELWLTFNPSSSADPVYQEFIKPFEHELSKNGYYEDDLHMIIKVNYCDNPFFPQNLEDLRLKHKETKSRAEYNHIWLGETNDSIENSIIKLEWFEAALDAHKIPHLEKVFEPKGAIVAAHDPSDSGDDAKGYALRHGSIIKRITCKDTGEIDEGCDWATENAIRDNADWFIWDGDGCGTGLKRQVQDAFRGKRVDTHMFKGSLSGSAQDNADFIWQETDEKDNNAKTYSETFLNNRSQYYMQLAQKFYNTYRCVEKGEYVDPSDMISIDTNGVDDIDRLKSEVCRIPRKPNNRGLYQIMSKLDMKKLDIPSPNMADSLMMSLYIPQVLEWGELEYSKTMVI
jgi:phage terminase large subunit